MGLISELLEEERNEQQVHAVVERNGGRPLRFIGEVLAEAGSSPDIATVWRTNLGAYVVNIVHHAAQEGQEDRRQAEAFDSLADAIDWLTRNAPGPIADELLAQLGEMAAESQAAN